MKSIIRRLSKHRTKVLVTMFLVAGGLLLFWQQPQKPIRIAVAKGGRMVEMSAALELVANQAAIRDFVLSDVRISELLDDSSYGFLYAYPLGSVESKAWRDGRCDIERCVQATLYNFVRGGTVEVIVNLDQAKVIDVWAEPDARPGASPYIVPRAMAAITSDSEVTELLGDARSAEPMMVPMSTWLMDGECGDNWCVDLTFSSPDGSGRILHAVVNMEKERVARVFYTRGRPERLFKRPAAQGANFNNGCHEEHGWSVCWEMTPHDGINFYDATFNDELIFSSAKISQVEVFYPSWPGGYRDEIGYGASVPPYFGTHVDELEDGFEVSQLFTEFLRWPNCICCYRYEQIIRFHADGSFDPVFVSHGPGCDDLSNYRPFWRIDLAAGEGLVDEVWVWDESQWVQADSEFSISLFDEQAPDGGIVYFSSSDTDYIWRPQKTDPVGEDDGRLFVLRTNEGEGDGPVPTGPADTFWPPGQWLDDESLEDQDLVVWYIPILHTKKVDPWWCMPDPEPDFSPCEAASSMQPMSELVQPPTREPDVTPDIEMTVVQEVTVTPIPIPTPTRRTILGDDPLSIIESSGCGSCHVIGILGESGKVGPDLSNIGNVAGQRVPGLSAVEYIRQSIVDPGVFIAPSCPNDPCLQEVMPTVYGKTLSSEQLDLIVAFLLEQKIDVRGQAAISPTRLPPVIGDEHGDPSQVDDRPRAEDNSAARSTSLIGAFILTLSITLLLTGLLVGIRRGQKTE
jgi:hypothetical protein